MESKGKKTKRVVIFPGGTEIGLEIWKALKDNKDILLYSAGSNVSNHAPYVFRHHFIIPDVHNNQWLENLIKVINKQKIDYIFPAHDDVVVALAENADKLNCKVISSPMDTCLTCRSKSKTYNKFKELLPVPKLFSSTDDIKTFPIFVKPDKGQGAQGTYKVDNIDILEGLLKSKPDLILMEYLPGKEYTVDCFTDRKKGLLFCNARERIRVKAGISVNSKPANKSIQSTLKKYAEIISDNLTFYGAWFFQVKYDKKGIPELLEISPRISGTMATYRVLGINFPLLSIYESDGIDIQIMNNNNKIEIDRALINRYKHNIKYNKVYVDLDDTLIIHNRINTELIKFIYQSINEECKIILISKTKGNINDTLKRWRLFGLFDKVIHVKNEDTKADFINPENAIFIDDSFSERKFVFEKYRIPTFDCSMIELLINDRV